MKWGNIETIIEQEREDFIKQSQISSASIDSARDRNRRLGYSIAAKLWAERATWFADWMISEDNPYNKRYTSDDDNDGLWYDEFSEGTNRHYYTTEELFVKYLKG